MTELWPEILDLLLLIGKILLVVIPLLYYGMLSGKQSSREAQA